jgi:hypothetical protein
MLFLARPVSCAYASNRKQNNFTAFWNRNNKSRELLRSIRHQLNITRKMKDKFGKDSVEYKQSSHSLKELQKRYLEHENQNAAYDIYDDFEYNDLDIDM